MAAPCSGNIILITDSYKVGRKNLKCTHAFMCETSHRARARFKIFNVCVYSRYHTINNTLRIPKSFILTLKAEVEFSRKPCSSGYSTYWKYGPQYASCKLKLWSPLFQKHLVGNVVTKEKIAEAKAVWDAHLGPGVFNEAGDILYI